MLEHYFLELLKTIYAYAIDILPYFFIANLLASSLEVYIGLGWLRKITKNTLSSTIFVAILGGALPFCSCSMIPLVNLINSQSKSYAPVLSFIAVAPVISPISIFLTYGLFGLKMTIFRLLGTFAFAFLLAFFADRFFKKPKTLPMRSSYKKQEISLSVFLNDLKVQFLNVGKYVFLGILIASFIEVLIPKSLIESFSYRPLSYPLMSVLGLSFYVCSGEEVPIAHAISKIGFTQGSALTFMLSSTGICMPTLFAIAKFLPKRMVYIYIISWVLFSILSGVMYDGI